MSVALLLLLVGGALLYFGADWLVAGASKLALSFQIPQLVVGLTVVAYGTSAPEIIVGIQAALAGRGGVAVGNIVGSNIANIGLILGTAVLVRPAPIAGELRKRELPVLLASALALVWVLRDGVVTRWEAGSLLLCAVVFTYVTVRSARSGVALARARDGAAVEAEAAHAAGAPDPVGRGRQAVIALLGLAVLLLGGNLFVRGATSLAALLGMSERVIGLTVVAIGTSLPELVTSVIAARRGHSNIAVGNVVGSNIFNVFLCLGVAGLLGTVKVEPAELRFDLAALLAMTVAALVVMRKSRTMPRREGALLLAGYLAYLTWVVIG